MTKAKIQAVKKKGAKQYITKIMEVRACLLSAPACASAITIKLLAVGVAVTKHATSTNGVCMVESGTILESRPLCTVTATNPNAIAG